MHRDRERERERERQRERQRQRQRQRQTDRQREREIKHFNIPGYQDSSIGSIRERETEREGERERGGGYGFYSAPYLSSVVTLTGGKKLLIE